MKQQNPEKSHEKKSWTNWAIWSGLLISLLTILSYFFLCCCSPLFIFFSFFFSLTLSDNSSSGTWVVQCVSLDDFQLSTQYQVRHCDEWNGNRIECSHSLAALFYFVGFLAIKLSLSLSTKTTKQLTFQLIHDTLIPNHQLLVLIQIQCASQCFIH